MNLLNIATLITLWIIALQYIINNFLAQWLEKIYWPSHGISGGFAEEKRDNFVTKLNWVIIGLYIVAVFVGTIGLIMDLM
ncbi:hypothetical protein KAR91_18675 [Candidatus Pacearchaeota archaeon]|nr:hypothetical protein [Candidatus Pacearchaeota archaeon]